MEKRQAIIDFLKDGLKKGYSMDQLKDILLMNGIQESEAKELLRFVQASVVPLEEMPENKFTPKLFVYIGLSLMVISYAIKIFLFAMPEESGSSLVRKVLNGFWPVLFLIIANIINFIYFRKSFARGLFITFIAIGLLILLVIILSMLGL